MFLCLVILSIKLAKTVNKIQTITAVVCYQMAATAVLCTFVCFHCGSQYQKADELVYLRLLNNWTQFDDVTCVHNANGVLPVVSS